MDKTIQEKINEAIDIYRKHHWRPIDPKSDDFARLNAIREEVLNALL